MREGGTDRERGRGSLRKSEEERKRGERAKTIHLSPNRPFRTRAN